MSIRSTTAKQAAARYGFVMLAMAAGIIAYGSASAQGHDGGRGRGPEQYREQGHDNGRHRGEDQRWQQGRGHDWEREHWRNSYRGYGREPARRPDIYYSAPPVMHLPPAYYQPPSGLSLNFGFPLYH
ncbi:MAG: hypothetical protein ABIQ82_02560 [Variovorax sp.]